MPKNNGAGEVLFASSHFAFERKGRSSQDGEGESYTLTDLDGVNRIDCKSGFGSTQSRGPSHSGQQQSVVLDLRQRFAAQAL